MLPSRSGAKADPLTMYYNDVCTIPSNLTGHPAISVPYGTGADGLPVGVQVLAPMLGEVDMFRAAAVLEESGLEPLGQNSPSIPNSEVGQ